MINFKYNKYIYFIPFIILLIILITIIVDIYIKDFKRMDKIEKDILEDFLNK